MVDLSKYQSLCNHGYDAVATYRALRKDGLEQIDGILMLRKVFSLSLADAKILAYEIDTGEPFHKRQPDLVKPFTDFCDELFGHDEKQ